MRGTEHTVIKGGLTSRKRKKRILDTVCFILLAAAALTVLMPLWFMVSTALKDMDEIFTYPITWYPHNPVWSNFKDAWMSADFTGWFLNSLFVAGFAILGGVLANSLVAYGFAKIKFPGRNILFTIILGTMMIPEFVTMIAQSGLGGYLPAADCSTVYGVGILYLYASSVLCGHSQFGNRIGADGWRVTFLYLEKDYAPYGKTSHYDGCSSLL